MDVKLPDDLLGVSDAEKELDALIAADVAKGDGTAQPTDKSATTPADTRAATEGAGDQQQKKDNDESKGKTEATDQKPAEAGKTEDAKPGEKAGDKKPDEKPAEKTRYEKARERQTKSWDELNAQKDALKVDRAALDKDREQLKREREEFQAEQAKAEEQFSPQQYEDAAKKFEADGKFDLAEMARKKAEDLKRNPPQKRADVQEAQRKEWALKAGVDFPELAKTNSPMQVRVAQLLAEDPEFKRHPKGIYVAARIASLEADMNRYKAQAAELPKKDEALKKLQARVTELEQQTAPGGEGGAQHLPAAKTFDQMSEDEQLASLERQAREVGTLTNR